MNIKDYTKIIGDTNLKIDGNAWDLVTNLRNLINDAIKNLGDEFVIENEVAIHKEATIEQNVVLKGPVIISKGCNVSANSYIRHGVYLAEGVSIGPGCEIKNSIILNNSTIAHLNYVGDSIIGSEVNIEGGAVLANHYNERENKEISVNVDGEIINTSITKFGALIGDKSRLGANSVTSPGTILKPGSIVKRLELVDQISSSSN